jgi:catechol 2,3-dioxygenase
VPFAGAPASRILGDMSTTPTPTAPAPAPATAATGRLADTTRLGAVHLTVTNLDRSVAFYQDALGLRLHRREDPVAAMGAGGEDLVVLVEEQTARRAGRHAGLYHFALLVPSREELARALQRLAVTRTPIDGASDHGISEAIYLPDPDGNGIEIAADRPREVWPKLETLGRPNPLDLYGLLGTLGDAAPVRHADLATIVGHVHLYVGDITAARGFYEDVVGFDPMTVMPNAVFVSVAAYHHHLGFNTWRGEGIPGAPAPQTVAGLRHWTVLLDGAAERDAVRARLDAAGVAVTEREDGLLVHDPAGIPLLLTVDGAATSAEAPAGAAELRSRADVVTDRPSPYLLQLAKHFRHKLDVTFDERAGTLPFAFGRCELRAGDGALHLEAIAATPEELERVEHVVGSHLERFGRRHALSVSWSPAATS